MKIIYGIVINILRYKASDIRWKLIEGGIKSRVLGTKLQGKQAIFIVFRYWYVNLREYNGALIFPRFKMSRID